MSFIDSIFEKAKANLKTIAIPEYDNDYMMKAAVKAHQDKIANILLVGPTAEIQKRAEALNLDITGMNIADPEDADYTKALLDRYAALPEKVMPRSFIAKRISSPLYLAVLIEAVGDADGTLAGVNATTYEFIMAANSTIGLKPGVSTASGVLIVEAEDFDGLQGTCFGMARSAFPPRWNSTLILPFPPARHSGPLRALSPGARSSLTPQTAAAAPANPSRRSARRWPWRRKCVLISKLMESSRRMPPLTNV